MASARENILEALATKLGAATGFTFYRSRETPVARAEGIVGMLRPATETVKYKATGITERILVVFVTLIARGDIPDSIVDPALIAMHASISGDRSLGGLCSLIVDEEVTWDFEMADGTALGVQTAYRINYLTPASSIATLA